MTPGQQGQVEKDAPSGRRSTWPSLGHGDCLGTELWSCSPSPPGLLLTIKGKPCQQSTLLLESQTVEKLVSAAQKKYVPWQSQRNMRYP